MLEKNVRDGLFREIHRAIDESVESTVSDIGKVEISYPPGTELTSDEVDALSSLKLSCSAKSGLRKIIADACCYPLFHFLSLLDGVADLYVDNGDVWCGATITEKTEEDELMLHDELYESYWLDKNDHA